MVLLSKTPEMHFEQNHYHALFRKKGGKKISTHSGFA